MNSIFFIAKRYAFSKSKTKTIHIITIISSLGIVASTMALFIVLSVFSGLEKHAKSFTNSLDADYVGLPKKGKTVEISTAQINKINKIKGIKAVCETVEDRVVFSYGKKQLVTAIKGVNKNYTEYSAIANYTENNLWISDFSYEAVIGRSIIYELGISQYSDEHQLKALAMKPGKGLISSPDEAYKQITLSPVNVYSFNNINIDKKYVFTSIDLAQSLLSLNKNEYSKLELYLTEQADLKNISTAIENIIPNTFIFKSRDQLNESLYKMLKTESLAIYSIFTLIIIITLFCLCGTIIMIILEKKTHIKTLFSLGLTYTQIRNIFFIQGSLISIGGMIIGITLGVLIALGQQKFNWLVINSEFPYPVIIEWENLFSVILTTLILSFVACWISSTQIKKQL